MNRMVRSQAMPPAVGTRDGDWVWDGTRWVCDPDCGSPPFPPGVVQVPGCPPPFFPPPQTQPPWYPGANGGVSFSPPGNPPPNPIRGAFWFDGAQLWLFDGAAWTGVGGTTPASGGSGTATGPTPPPNPQVGALWWDGNALLVWDGIKWDVAGGGTSTGNTPPSNPQNGQQWFNGSTLYIWDGNAWVPTSQTQTFIQPTPPPSPSPGDQWWDGTQMRIWDGHQWELVGPGATVGPVATTSIVFALTHTTALAVTNTWTIMPYTNVPQIDTMNGYNPVTHTFTPTKPGLYAVMLRAPFTVAAAGVVGLAVVKNDGGTFTGLSSDIVPAIGYFNNQIGVTTSDWLNPFGMVQMNGTTDYLRAFGLASAGCTLNSAGSNPSFTAVLFP